MKPIENFSQEKCPFCQSHFHAIRIQGDQFAVTPPNLSQVEIKATDLEAQHKAELSAIAGLRAFVAYRRRLGGRIATIGMNVKPILEGDPTEKSRALLTRVREKWRSIVQRSTPVSLRSVVVCSYPGSGELAKTIADPVRRLLRHPTSLKVVTPTELRTLPRQPGASAVVINACIAKELLDVSLTLRDVQEGGGIAYLSVVNLLSPKAESDRLGSNITFGTHGANTFSLHSLLTFRIDCLEEAVSWKQELDELKRLCDWAAASDLDVPTEIDDRIALLEHAPATGLIDNLFWPEPSGESLRLRSDFSLIDGSLREPKATQADLFAIICLILTNLRSTPDASRRLSRNAYERAVLAPGNFHRFSDGVLQACLLRAARPAELSYGACDPSISDQMLGILLHSLPDLSAPDLAPVFPDTAYPQCSAAGLV